MTVTTHSEPHLPAVTLGRLKAIRPATHRALAARDLLLSDYRPWGTWRRQSRASKTEAVARLDELLEELDRAG